MKHKDRNGTAVETNHIDHIQSLSEKRASAALPSEMVQDIVSTRPDFITRWGTWFFFVILCFAGFICWLIKYPDIIPATARLTSINAPKPVVSLINGKLVKLSTAENEVVRKGQVLGYLESTADHNDVLQLSVSIDSISQVLIRGGTDRLQDYFQNPDLHLGELQMTYQAYLTAHLTFLNYLSKGFYVKKKAMLLKDMDNLKKLHKHLSEQKMLQEQDLLLTQKTFDANESLNKEKVISDFDYRMEQSKLINKKLTFPQINAAIISNENQQNEKAKEILELENTINQQKYIYHQALNTFKSQVDEWKKKYVLIAPVAGKIAFASFVQENQQIQANQTILYVNPDNSEYFAEVVIPQSNFGKAAKGQLVLLKFRSYPYQEYGAVKGRIEFISRIPLDSGYLAKVGLVSGLNTTYNRQVHYRDGLLANAEIITRDMRLLERFYYNLVKNIRK